MQVRILRSIGICGIVSLMAAGNIGAQSISASSITSTKSATSATTSSSVKLIVDDELIPADAPPQIYKGRVMVPLRWVSEALGSRVTWDNKNKIVTVDTDFVPDKSKESTQGIQAWIKGNPLPKDEPILVDQGRVLVPARLVAEGLGANVEWVSKEQAVYIRFAASKGKNEWKDVNIKQFSEMQFIQPVGWGFSRSSGAPSSDKVQKQLDQSLDELLTLLKQGKQVNPLELKEPIRRVNFSINNYVDSEGSKQYGGGLDLSISGSYAKLVWQGTLVRPVYLHFSNDRLNTVLDKVEQLLPEPFPTFQIKTTTLPPAVIKSDFIKTSSASQEDLPFFYPGRIFIEPVSGEWGIFNYFSADNTMQLQSSSDGVNWHLNDMVAFGELTPFAIGKLHDDASTLLLTNSADSSIYRAELSSSDTELSWERVWEYPWPEANDKYSPVQYIPDPVQTNRVYTAFSHDTRFSSTKGLFMSEDSGLSWFESGINGRNDVQFAFPEPALPDPKKAGTVYMETGLWMDASNDMNYYLFGSVLMSQNAGRNWVQFEGIDELYDVSENGNGAVMTAARHDSYTSWLLTSRDHGASWSERKLPFKISDLRVNPDNSKMMIATPLSTSRPGTMPYYSSDGGATWKPIDLPDKYIQYWIPESNLVYVHGDKGTAVYRLKI